MKNKLNNHWHAVMAARLSVAGWLLCAPAAFALSAVDYFGLSNPPGSSYDQNGPYWNPTSETSTPLAGFVVGDVMVIGVNPADFNGSHYTINLDNGGSWTGGSITIGSTNAMITFIGTTNTRFGIPFTVSVAGGSTLIWDVTLNGGFNFNNEPVTLTGAGTQIFQTEIGGNDSALFTENMTGGSVVLAQTSTGSLVPHSGGYTLTAGNLFFLNGFAISNAFNSSSNGSLFSINGGSLDNLSGAPATLGLGAAACRLGGNFTFNGSSSLSFGPNAVALLTNVTVTKLANTLTLGGISGPGFGLTVTGPGTLAIASNSTYTGATAVNAGTLALTGAGSIFSSPQIALSSGATLDVSQVPFVLAGGQTLTGTGLVNGTVSTVSNSVISPGFGAGGALIFSNNLALNPGNICVFDLSSNINGANGQLVVGGNVTLNGATVQISAPALQSGRYRLIVYDGVENGSAAANLTLSYVPPSGVTVALDDSIPGEIDLVVTAGKKTPVFSNLTPSQAVAYGTTTITLAGTLSAGGPVYPALGEPIVVTIGGSAQMTSIIDNSGDFSMGYNPAALRPSASAYPVTYSYAGDASLNSASNTASTLAVNPLPVILTGARAYDGTATATAAILSVANAVGKDNVTVASGSATLAGASAGPEAIISVGTLALGGVSVSNYTLIGASGTVTVQFSSSCVTPPANMVLWLPFDETGGSVSANLASPANFGTQVGGPSVVFGAYVDNSLSFNGSQYVAVPDYSAIDIGASNLTIDAWVNRSTNAPASPPCVIVDKRDINTSVGYSLALSSNSLLFQMSGINFRDTIGMVPPDGQWHFVAVSVNQASTTPVGQFYVDHGPTGTFTPAPGNLSNTNSLWVAASPLRGNQPWVGGIDEVEVYNRALATNEIEAIYSAGSNGKCKPSCLEITVNCPANKTVQCGSGWTFDMPTGSNCCGTNVTVTPIGTTSSGVCPQFITQNWLLTDSCGHSNVCSQTVTVVNTNGLELTCASNLTVSVGQQWSFQPPTAPTGSCCTNLTIIASPVETNVSASPCGTNFIYTEMWQVTDCCSNTGVCIQTVTVVENELSVLSAYAPCGETNLTVAFNNPVLAESAANPANYEILCGGQIFHVLSAQVSGDDRLVVLTLAQPLEGANCSLLIANLQDVCGDTLAGTNFSVGCATNGACAYNNSGTEFWLTFPGNYAPDPNSPPQVELYISGAPGTIGTVSMITPPFNVSFAIPATGMFPVSLPPAADLGNDNDGIETNGVHVLASGPVTIDAFDHVPFTSDAYLALPTGALGDAYVALCYNNVYVGVPELNGTQFAIVATADNTIVTIVPLVQVGSHPAGVPFNVSLMQGQTYQLRDTDDAPADLTGTAIASTQPIAVFGGHQCAAIPSGSYFFCDYLVQQLLPVPNWGTSFLTVPFQTRLNGDTFRCLAWRPNTAISLNGTLVAVINKGQFLQIQLAGASQITATEPILVAQYADSSDFDSVVNADPLMSMVPPVASYGSSYMVTVPSAGYFPTSGDYFNIVAPNGSVVLVDNVPLPGAAFKPLGATGYSWTQNGPVNPGPHTITGVGGADIGVTVYGWAQYDAYGYPAGFCSALPGTPTNSFTKPQTNAVQLVIGSNNLAVVPDLTSYVGNAAAAFMVLQVPQAGTLVGPGTYPLVLTAIDQFGQRYAFQITLTVAGTTGGTISAASLSGSAITLTWSGTAVLQTASSLGGPWTTVQGAVSPYAAPITNKQGYFRTISQ